ncbi:MULTISPECIES: coproporphyrinogen dehydrogenase HemZ [Pseudobutyrivibrio]|uniref:Oxygen-independent coproporphyrinogen-3 oxidase n=1 Tax=Pseudobutyrivibrio ruminis DSM 9787 TaxID=1123011 RepID=A0A285S839_9FIRM|nr:MULTISPECIES: coproporphyrinogen dehydrogenase HemZ [Pseudobutyrivibrio]SOC01415.1 oxygen-independent coproporphyrinogen-3 oxidase [Pseudobutyrivibrio ruminis DSM 9787]
MIYIQLNEDNFEYDIYSLVKAFYPKEEVKISTEPTPEDAGLLFSMQVNYSDNVLTLDGREIEIDYSDRPDTKNRLKLAIYESLSKRTGKELPWGTLTGIRPTKISLGMIEDGADDEAIASYMKDTYRTSDAKINLSLQVSHKEHELLSKIDYDNGYSVYIGIPFCPSTCLYCSFTSYPIGLWKKKLDDYLDALEKEMAFTAESCKEKSLTTIYIGGGTPTSLDEEHLEKLLTLVDKYFDTKSLLEYTIEAGRPDSITYEKLQIMKNHPVSRISINPQTMNQKTLDLIGRFHKVEDIHRVYGWARELGFDNINMDLILGLPGETIEDVKYTLDEVEKMAPDNLTVHSLALKHSARLNIDRESYDDYLIENSQTHMDICLDCANHMGMNAYYLYRQKNMAANLENIGYAMPGKEGLYNILIMEEKQTIMALGAGCSCKFVADHGKTVTRCENVKDVQLYIDRIDEMIDRKRERLREDLKWL